MNILETILAAQGGNGVRQMADRVGLDQGQAQSAIEALLPMLAGAVSRNAQQPGGLEGLLGALSDGHHQRYIDDPATLEDESTIQDGNAILGHLFGDREVSRQAAARASAQTGIGADVLRKMLPMLAAMLMGGLSKGASQGGMFGSPSAGQDGLGGALGGGGMGGGGMGGALGGGMGGGLGQVLGGLLGGGQRPGMGQAQPQAGGGLLEMLTPMLDRNRDGSAMDDILGMAAQFLQRR
jgi:hypothetical protein